MQTLSRPLVFFFFLAASSPVSAQIALLSPTGPEKITGQTMLVFEDKTGSLGVEEILDPPILSQFAPAQGVNPAYGFTSSAIWVLLELRGRGPGDGWFIEVEEPLLHRVELHGPILAGKTPTMAVAGRIVPF